MKILSGTTLGRAKKPHVDGHFTVLENVKHILDGQRLLVRRFAHVSRKLLPHIRAFLLSQPFRLLGEIRDGKEPGKGHDAGQDALDEEDPPPAVISTEALHLPQSAGQQAAKGTGQSGGAEEECEAALGFIAPVPHTHEVEACWGQLQAFTPSFFP